ncbi:MAG: hypothetical protein ACJ8KF_01100 [Chthoniobacterales bacterium]
MPVPVRNRESLRVSVSPESWRATTSLRDSFYALRHHSAQHFYRNWGTA